MYFYAFTKLNEEQILNNNTESSCIWNLKYQVVFFYLLHFYRLTVYLMLHTCMYIECKIITWISYAVTGSEKGTSWLWVICLNHKARGLPTPTYFVLWFFLFFCNVFFLGLVHLVWPKMCLKGKATKFSVLEVITWPCAFKSLDVSLL